MMKKILKSVYTALCHPYIFFNNKAKNIYLKKGGIIKGSRNIVFGFNVSIGHDVRIQFFGNGKLVLDDNVYICNRCSFLVGGNIHLSKNVLVASDVLFSSESHSVDPESDLHYSEQPLIMGNIYIGEGSWIGEKAVILPNVEIGRKCIIGAGSIVTHSVPDYTIAAGNPARIIKKYSFRTHQWENYNG